MPARDVRELIAYVKANPDKVSYASFGAGTSSHIYGEVFVRKTGIDAVHVPYKGSAPALTDLLGGQLQLMFTDIPPALAHVRSGRLRALAVTSLKRQSALPETPTVAESGLPGTQGFEAVAWQSLVAPAGTPRELLHHYSVLLGRIMGQPELRERLLREGFEPGASTPEQLAVYMRKETGRWAKVIHAAGITAD